MLADLQGTRRAAYLDSLVVRIVPASYLGFQNLKAFRHFVEPVEPVELVVAAVTSVVAAPGYVAVAVFAVVTPVVEKAAGWWPLEEEKSVINRCSI